MAALPELAFESMRTLSQEEFAAWVAARWRGDLNHYELLEGRVAMPPPEEGRFLRVVPDLVVEILSPSTAALDRGEKKDVYERNGVHEYWPIDPRARTLLIHTRQGDRFDTGRTFAEGQPFSSAVLAGLAFDVASVL